MTTLERAMSRRVDPSRRASRPRWQRFGRWVAAKGWVHVLLLTGLAICIYPLIWMFLTSIKTDDDLSQNEFFPSIPVFRDHSPYVRDPVAVSRISDVSPSRFAEVLPRLEELTSFVVLSHLPKPIPPSIDPLRWAASAASVLLNRTLAQLPKQVWDDRAEIVTERYGELLTPDAIAAAFGDQLSRLELSALTLRTQDGRLFKLAAGAGSAGWRVQSGTGSLAPIGDAVRLDYRFDAADRPILVVCEFDLPDKVEPSDIHKLVLSA